MRQWDSMNSEGLAVSVFLIFPSQDSNGNTPGYLSSLKKEYDGGRSFFCTVMVKDPYKSVPMFKPPGGKNDIGESHPYRTGEREVEEETGIVIDLAALSGLGALQVLADRRVEGARDVGFHRKILYAAVLSEPPPWIKDRGDEGEIVSVFRLEELWEMADMLPVYYVAMEPLLKCLLGK